MTSRLSGRFQVLAELVFEAGDDNAFVVDVERLLLEYSPGDYLRLGAGRYHTGIGSRDENDLKALNVRVSSRPATLPELELGVGLYRDHLEPEGGPRVAETILAGFAVYSSLSLEFLNEVVWIKHRPRGQGEGSTTTAFYSQLSRRWGRARPYSRYEYLKVPDADPIAGGLGRRVALTLGVRLDLTTCASLKAHYGRHTARGRSTTNGFEVQAAFAF